MNTQPKSIKVLSKTETVGANHNVMAVLVPNEAAKLDGAFKNFTNLTVLSAVLRDYVRRGYNIHFQRSGVTYHLEASKAN